MAKSEHVSPFAPAIVPTLPAIEGVKLASAEAGIKYKNRTDLLVAVFDPGTVCAGVTTRSKTASASVEWCRASLAAGGNARMLVVNSGNANAFTGQKGRDTVATVAKAASDALGCDPHEVYQSSTGVIGEPLDPGKFAHLLAKLAEAAKPDQFGDAARAIMTTDTFPKVATRTVEVAGATVTINGIAKGAGMIAPDMATMLSYVFTDAAIAQDVLQRLVSRFVETTFNCVTVDSDTSTSDTFLAFATGAAAGRGQRPITDFADPDLTPFAAALEDLMRDLAIQVAKDGEGLTKFVTVEVTGAESDTAAKSIGLACANSPLIKTAIAGEDPNWGRVVMAVGKSGEAADRDRLAIWFGPHCVAREGERATEYDEAIVAAYMKNSEITIRVDVGIGAGQATIWTCDLTHGYISINADYRS